jgi:hypothetical protein
MRAVCDRKIDLALVLIGAGCDVQTKSSESESESEAVTPLHVAAGKGYV